MVFGMPPTHEWTRVVVLSPPSLAAGRTTGLSDGLKSLFAARDWFAIEQHDPYLAMAELCLRERAQVARAGWGLQRMEQIALVILEPERWPRLDELVSAVNEYLPNATVWTATDSDVTPLNSPDQADARPAAAPPPTLRYTAMANKNSISDDGPVATKMNRPNPGLRIAGAPQPIPPAPRSAESANGAHDDDPTPRPALMNEDEADAAATSQRITREEIQMLLQDEDREAAS